MAALSERGQRLLEDFPALAALRCHDRRGVDDLVKIVDSCDEFNRRYARHVALKIDKRIGEEPDYFDWEIARAGCKYRLLSIAIPKRLGGVAPKYLVSGMALAMEELCSTCGGIGLMFGATSLGIAPVLTAGAMGHWDTMLGDIAEQEKQGNPVMVAYAITEPSAGTDVEDPEFLRVGKIGMEAKKVKGGYVLNGRKCFISNGREAKYVTVCTALDRNRPLETWTTFLVNKDMTGYSTPRVERKMGQRASHATELLFEDVFVPNSNVLGYAGDGMSNGILMVMAASRGPVGAIATGIASGAYEHFLNWARTVNNGHAPIEEERIRMAAADMQAMLSQNRALYLNATMAADRAFCKVLGSPPVFATLSIPRPIRTWKPVLALLNSPIGKFIVNSVMSFYISDPEMTQVLALASMAKFACGDNAMRICSRALELMGADDSEERLWVEKAFRDAKLTQIYEGTNQLNRLCLYDARISRELAVEIPRPIKQEVV